jgi:hypothetical protein
MKRKLVSEKYKELNDNEIKKTAVHSMILDNFLS